MRLILFTHYNDKGASFTSTVTVRLLLRPYYSYDNMTNIRDVNPSNKEQKKYLTSD